MLEIEWVAMINGKLSHSDGALFKCNQCKYNNWTWIGWWPKCSVGHDQRKPKNPYSILNEFDSWYRWELENE